METRIGIIGSAFNLKEEDIKVAKALGKILAKRQTDFFICYDKESLPMEAGKELIRNGKKITCFVANKDEEIEASKIGFNSINLNLPRMFREIVFVNNIDLVIVLGGGSGTLMEVTFAYQLNKQIFVLNEISGSVDTFKDKYLDRRERIKIKSLSVEHLEAIFKQNNTFKFEENLL